MIDTSKNMPDFFIDIFENEEKYQFLIKEFDSKDYDYKYNIKKFRINYQ